MNTKYNYSPGFPGYGVKGNDGSIGLNGMATYFTLLDGVSNQTTITALIADNRILKDGTPEYLPGYPTRKYQDGDIIIDKNAASYEIDLESTNLYIASGAGLSTSGSFTKLSGVTSQSGHERLFNNTSPTEKLLIDQIYTNSPGDYTVYPSEIYGIKPEDYNSIRFSDIVVNSNYIPFQLWSTGNTNDDDAIALVRSAASNIWRLGNIDAGSTLRSTNLRLDFSNTQISGSLNVENGIYGDIYGDINTDNLTLPGWADIEGDVSINSSLYINDFIELSKTNIGNLAIRFENDSDKGIWSEGEVLGFAVNTNHYLKLTSNGSKLTMNTNNDTEILIEDSGSGGGDLTLSAGNTTSGNGGNTSIFAGNSWIGRGGNMILNGGSGYTGGDVSINGGFGNSTYVGGNVMIRGGNSDSAPSGAVYIDSGYSNSAIDEKVYINKAHIRLFHSSMTNPGICHTNHSGNGFFIDTANSGMVGMTLSNRDSAVYLNRPSTSDPLSYLETTRGLEIKGVDVTSGTGNKINIRAGYTDDGIGGELGLYGGSSKNAGGGNVRITSGGSETTSAWTGGDVIIKTGANANGENPGDIIMSVESTAGASDHGRIYMYGLDINTSASGHLAYDGYRVYLDTTTPGSDINLKNIDSSINSPLNRILKLNAFNYKMNDIAKIAIGADTEKMMMGVSAQDASLVFPELVGQFVGNDSSTYLNFDYNGLIPVFIEAIKEQHNIIEDQSTKINELEEKLNKLIEALDVSV